MIVALMKNNQSISGRLEDSKYRCVSEHQPDKLRREYSVASLDVMSRITMMTTKLLGLRCNILVNLLMEISLFRFSNPVTLVAQSSNVFSDSVV
jgi:hypothetical protein